MIVVLAWRLHTWPAQRDHAAPLRQLTIAAVVLAALAARFGLPDNPDAVTAPATLMGDCRLLSAASI
ncbi:hypothetical protein [Streptomyces sp. NPDC005799]|uniref:hypothetical protein n=1 Tax=Streptomyces sp. NPDC005799 TaxID=3154678 RepID=UPI0033CD0F7A